MSMYYRKKTPRVTGAARGFKSTGMGTRKAYIASLRATPAAYTATLRNRAPRRQIKGAIAPYGGRQELKYLDTSLAGPLAVDTTGSVTLLNGIAVGDDNTSRDGRQVTIKSVQIHGKITPADSTTNYGTKCRCLLVWDNANNSAAAVPTIATILASSTSMAFPLVDNANRFTILKDWVDTVAGVDTGYAYGQCAADVEMYLKINQVTQYSGTTSAIGSIQNGSLLFVTIGDLAATSACVFSGNARVRFTDN